MNCSITARLTSTGTPFTVAEANILLLDRALLLPRPLRASRRLSCPTLLRSAMIYVLGVATTPMSNACAQSA
jgi:hypothetical protein